MTPPVNDRSSALRQSYALSGEQRRELQSVVEASPDASSVSAYIAEFSVRHPELWRRVLNERHHLERLLTIFGYSRFLAEELLRTPEWLWELDDLGRDLSRSDYEGLLTEFLRQEAASAPTAVLLARFRRKQLLRIVLRDVLSRASVQQVTEDLSNLADAILGCALNGAVIEMTARYGSPTVHEESGAHTPAFFTVLAVGKLGGRELNYSSDIDLIFVFSENGETTGPQVITNKEYFKKVANQFTNTLSTYTAAGLCYRVDLRLRPEGKLGEVCMTLAAAKEYYARRARDWELQMLIKARVATGHAATGQALLDFVEPAIYASSIDFSTIETMSAARERISEKVARRRLTSHELDVKLAPGGIRDIEFLVQCLQRLHGGREPSVRHGGTLLALSGLHSKGLLWTTEYSRLQNAYEFLRHLEHRLQFEEDRQVHALPSDATRMERIARRMPPEPGVAAEPGTNAATRLLQTLNKHLENVQGIYESIVHAQRPLHYGPGSAASATSEMPRSGEERVKPGMSQAALASIEHEAPRLAERLRSRGLSRSERRLASFLDTLNGDSASLRLLDTDSALADHLVQIFELSPYLSEQIIRWPELVEEVRRATEQREKRWAFEGLAAPINDIDGLRRFFRREMFRVQAASLCLAEPVFQTLDRTSALAEFVIARAYRIAREQGVAHARAHATVEKPFAEPASEMMVVALGRLGMREFDLGSDADLLFIIPDAETERQRFWTRVAEHLIEILTAYSAEGVILSLDTRLRPNGREGMLVQTESKYVEYFSTKAEAWEGIAYMKARGVAGDTERALAFLTELQKVDWRRYGQNGRSKQDLRQMRLRLQREQGKITPLKAGEGGYYDADFILMYLRLKGAGLFFKSLNTPERIDVVEKMGHLERGDAEFLMEATTFFRALDHALRIVIGRAEEKLPSAGEEHDMLVDLVHRWTGGSSAASLEEELASVRSRMRRLFEAVFTH